MILMLLYQKTSNNAMIGIKNGSSLHLFSVNLYVTWRELLSGVHYRCQHGRQDDRAVSGRYPLPLKIHTCIRPAKLWGFISSRRCCSFGDSKQTAVQVGRLT